MSHHNHHTHHRQQHLPVRVHVCHLANTSAAILSTIMVVEFSPIIKFYVGVTAGGLWFIASVITWRETAVHLEDHRL